MGRPPVENPKSEMMRIRVNPDEKIEIMKFAHENGYTLLELLKIGIEAVKSK